MSVKSLFRRAVTLAGLVLVTVGTSTMVAAPAQAALPASQLSVFPTTVNPGDTVTITQTLTNSLATSLLSPVAQLVSKPGGLSSFSTLVSCSGAASCGVLDDANGDPTGFQAILPTSLNPFDGESVVTYTLKILPEAPDMQETLQGRLLGQNFLSELLNGALLIIDANADSSVSVEAFPKLDVLGMLLEVEITVTNHGPGQLLVGDFLTSVPAELVPIGIPPCVGVPGGITSGQVHCIVPLLPKGASTTLRFSAPVTLLNIGLPYTFKTERFLSLSRDLNPENDKDSTSCIVVSIVLTTCGLLNLPS
jgi:hypothetical protein